MELGRGPMDVPEHNDERRAAEQDLDHGQSKNSTLHMGRDAQNSCVFDQLKSPKRHIVVSLPPRLMSRNGPLRFEGTISRNLKAFDMRRSIDFSLLPADHK